MKHLKAYNEFKLNENNDNKELPKILYHATPASNVDSILKNGLVPKLENHLAASGEIHEDRIFLSIYNDPFNMNLPEPKINSDLKMLTISTEGLDINNFYPDDSLYWAFYNDELSDEALAILFPKYFKRFSKLKNEDELSFSEWLLERDLDVTNQELENLLKGKYYLTLPNSGMFYDYDAGEIAYKGIIPPKNILSISDVDI